MEKRNQFRFPTPGGTFPQKSNSILTGRLGKGQLPVSWLHETQVDEKRAQIESKALGSRPFVHQASRPPGLSSRPQPFHRGVRGPPLPGPSRRINILLQVMYLGAAVLIPEFTANELQGAGGYFNTLRRYLKTRLLMNARMLLHQSALTA